ncbi:sugar phosphate isomerase/epimerase [Halobacteria archaeon AArc-m2/3/4]|uniref:Sugar phosphate isomerase/epimerase n=1 Tax=Natronoglomus mannanivorans TaxID=2979990 RepID=A0AAP3E1W1_9EURY|nr:sugar phosphate isomerase/epimerase [Halobacteria archaeon AArc-xg1-1]MCU4975639.1 sugar phosphate isomerase/epimerase [Halobacteria archaeon AArc-m2/3/4]
MNLGAMESILPSKAPESITEAAAAGFDGLELDVAGPDPGDDPVWDPASRDRIRRRAAERELEIPSICLGFLNRGGLTADDPDVRADARTAIRRSVDAAAALDAEVVLVPFFGDATIETERHRDRVVDGIRRVADSADAAGVTLALENTRSGRVNRDLLERIDSPVVGTYYDVGNAIAYGLDPVDDILTLGDYVARVHVKDWDAGGERAENGDEDAIGSCPIGEGQVDFEGCLDALAQVGYDDWIVLETASPTDPMADAETNLERTRELLEASSLDI